MSETSRGSERPPLPPVEAHPEPGPDPKDIPLNEKFMRKMQDSTATRRAVLGGAAVLTAAGLVYGVNKLTQGEPKAQAQSDENAEQLEPQPMYASLDKKGRRLEVSDVAESWQPSFNFVELAPGEPLIPPKFREFTTDEEFQKSDNKYLEADAYGLPDGAHLKLMLSGRDNEKGPGDFPTSIPNPEDPEKTLFLWGILTDSDGNPIDPTGESAEGKVYATSPIFFTPEEKIED